MTTPCFDFGRFELRPAERRVLVDGQPLALGARAFDLLLALAERGGRIATKEELMQAVWPGLVVEDNNLTVQISTLRKLLGRELIATVSGRGYRFTAMPLVAPAAAPPAAPARARGNLPAALPALYGRDDELRALAATCAESPLVTLCGAGGIGKTSLAAAVARQLAPDFEQGAWVVELAAIGDPALVLPGVAACLGVQLPGQAAPADELALALQGQSLLLVMDNCEHLLGAVATLAHALLRGAPGVHLLATSQEPLRVAGEIVYRLAPLAVPAPGDTAQARDFGAVRLFVERVRAQQGQAELGAQDLADAVEICRELDGLALAIELAAARVPLLGVAGVRSRLSERLQLLTVGPRVALRRHQTLRAALAWSHQLLDAEVQVLLRRLGIFNGGFSLEAALRVAGSAGMTGVTGTAEAGVAALDGQVLLDRLAVLVDRSLLTLEPGPRPRWRMLESMREFALECLQAAGETEAWKRRHAHATRDIVLMAVRQRDSAWLWAEMNNVRAALQWALATAGEGEVAIALATHTAVVLATAGPVPEALHNLHRVQPLIDEHTPPALAAQYWQWLGRLGIEGRLPTSRCIAALERAAAMFTAIGNRRHVHACRRQMAEALVLTGDLAAATEQLHAAEAAESTDLPPADRMRRLRVAGLLADARGDAAEAMRLTASALAIAEAHDIERYNLILLADRAWVQLRMGQAEAAVEGLRALLREIGGNPRDGRTRAYALTGLTAALVAAGRLQEARAGAAGTVKLLRGNGNFLAYGDIFAWLAAASSHGDVAAQLLGATDQFHRRGETHRDRLGQHARDEAERLIGAALAPAEASFWAAQGCQAEEALLAHLLERAFAAAPPA